MGHGYRIAARNLGLRVKRLHVGATEAIVLRYSCEPVQCRCGCFTGMPRFLHRLYRCQETTALEPPTLKNTAFKIPYSL